MIIQNTVKWEKGSWRRLKAHQQPQYLDIQKTEVELQKIRQFPSIVSVQEQQKLRQLISQVNNKDAFILQMGDCAELFDDCKENIIEQKILLMDLCAYLMSAITQKNIIKINRLAGQYSKPRTEEWDQKLNMYNYKGDNINSLCAEAEKRVPDPERLTDGYLRSAATMNYIRQAKCNNKCNKNAIKNCLEELEQNFVNGQKEEFKKIQNLILDRVQDQKENIFSENQFVSHEALILEYEEAQTRELENEFFDLSAHMLWIGERTRGVADAHVEFARGLETPIGVKIGPSINVEEFGDLVKKLNPLNKNDKLLVYPRLGVKNIENILPQLIEIKQKNKLNFTWVCDPCHGNTKSTTEQFKTRFYDDIEQEINSFFKILEQYGEIAGGLHIETSQDRNITEVISGNNCLLTNIQNNDVGKFYKSACDPRLNFLQTLELLFNVSNKMLSENTDNK